LEVEVGVGFKPVVLQQDLGALVAGELIGLAR
jgi:hypothetical protein